MSLITPRSAGRHLMVLDDAETIARQARRRAAVQRRRRAALQQVGAAGVVVALGAIVMGVPVVTVGAVLLALVVALAVALQRVVSRQRQASGRRRRASIGSGIGTPRPKGGFSTTRHRSGMPVWVDERAA